MVTLGIDIGSTTSKCALLKDGAEIIATSLYSGIGTDSPGRHWRRCLVQAAIQLTRLHVQLLQLCWKFHAIIKSASFPAMHLGASFSKLRTLIDVEGRTPRLFCFRRAEK